MTIPHLFVIIYTTREIIKILPKPTIALWRVWGSDPQRKKKKGENKMDAMILLEIAMGFTLWAIVEVAERLYLK